MSKEDMAHWSIYIKGVRFPLSKKELIEACRNNNASASFLETLNNVSDVTYHTAADVGREMKKQK